MRNRSKESDVGKANTFNVKDMKRKIIKKSHNFNMNSVKIYIGESIEKKCARIVENKEPISDGAPMVYTEKKDGVQPQYDIRTDKWEIAQNAMDTVNKAKIAKGQQPPTQEKKPETQAQTTTEQGGTATVQS